MNELKKYDKMLEEIGSLAIGDYVAILSEILGERESDQCRERVKRRLGKKYLNKSIPCIDLLREAYFHLQMFAAIMMIVNVVSEKIACNVKP